LAGFTAGGAFGFEPRLVRLHDVDEDSIERNEPSLALAFGRVAFDDLAGVGGGPVAGQREGAAFEVDALPAEAEQLAASGAVGEVQPEPRNQPLVGVVGQERKDLLGLPDVVAALVGLRRRARDVVLAVACTGWYAAAAGRR
jgi:hypothetical protein